jgi:hypothetical protein
MVSDIEVPSHSAVRREHTSRMVTFRVPADFGAAVAEVAGDFSAWVPLAMLHDGSGGFHLDVVLDRGRHFRYRFLLDGEQWINDPRAGRFSAGPNGSPASVIVT